MHCKWLNTKQYPPRNQADIIRQYAADHTINIVRVYSDHGRSGLNIAGREGLNQLMEDIEAKRTDFTSFLVYDVSRWEPFQDVDESAYYEYVLTMQRSQFSLLQHADDLLHTEPPLLHPKSSALSGQDWPKTNIQTGSAIPGPITGKLSNRGLSSVCVAPLKRSSIAAMTFAVLSVTDSTQVWHVTSGWSGGS